MMVVVCGIGIARKMELIIYMVSPNVVMRKSVTTPTRVVVVVDMMVQAKEVVMAVVWAVVVVRVVMS